jgi:hypothetical protein
MTSALNGTRQDALVTGTGACLPARTDLPIIGDEPSEHIPFFVINTYGFVSTKLAKFRTGKETALSSAAFVASFI